MTFHRPLLYSSHSILHYCHEYFIRKNFQIFLVDSADVHYFNKLYFPSFPSNIFLLFSLYENGIISLWDFYSRNKLDDCC